MLEAILHSQTLENGRRIWVQPPHDERPAQAVCILLDGEYYVQRMAAPDVIRALQKSGQLPPIAVAYVSHIDGPTRWRESFCNERFARFVSEELIPWAKKFISLGDDATVILGGLSLTGLAAAHAALLYPEFISGALCQSASFWWENNWIVHECRKRKHRLPTFRISCGSLETAEYAEHGPELIQRTSQLDCNRLMRDALLDRGCKVSFEEFNGGHDIASWKSDLPKSLSALLIGV